MQDATPLNIVVGQPIGLFWASALFSDQIENSFSTRMQGRWQLSRNLRFRERPESAQDLVYVSYTCF